MVEFFGPPSNAVRNRPITDALRGILESAAVENGVQQVVVVSGGQVSNHIASLKGVVGGWTGSHRHDNGRAADVMLKKNGTFLQFTNNDGSQVASFVSAVAARGATGIGAATDYMGNKTIHIGFGNSVSDTQKLVWGRNGASVNAPQWLRQAATAGWNNPVEMSISNTLVNSAFTAARDGVWLRKGPGLEFDKIKLLAAKTPLTVLGVDGHWSRVDLEGDNLVDGHVHSAFISTQPSFEFPEFNEQVAEPSDGADEVAEKSAGVLKKKMRKGVRT